MLRVVEMRRTGVCSKRCDVEDDDFDFASGQTTSDGGPETTSACETKNSMRKHLASESSPRGDYEKRYRDSPPVIKTISPPSG